MPRNGSGIYNLPDTYEAVSGETIEAQQHNDPLEDLESDANDARPIIAGGTGATTAAGARANLGLGYADETAKESFRSNLGATEIGDALFTADDAKTARSNIGAVGNLHKITHITTSGAHDFDAETKYVEVEVLGGGGAGGGAVATSSGQACAGAGGAAGGYARKFFAKTASSATIVIGAGGTGVSGDNGGNGGNSSYTDGTETLTANGGAGGLVGVASTGWRTQAAAAGGSASGGSINRTGDHGGPGFSMGTGLNDASSTRAGSGASSLYGAGGRAEASLTNASYSANGVAANGYCSGGAGGRANGGGSAATGGNGAPGIVIIKEYK